MLITQWNMAACEIFYNSRWRVSICMFLQNNSKIRCFLPSVWATETPEKAAEKNRNKTKKKVGNLLRGSRQRTGCPNKYVQMWDSPEFAYTVWISSICEHVLDINQGDTPASGHHTCSWIVGGFVECLSLFIVTNCKNRNIVTSLQYACVRDLSKAL